MGGRKIRTLQPSHRDAFSDAWMGITLADCMVGSCYFDTSHPAALALQSAHLHFHNLGTAFDAK